ncbi:MAG: hypothetical protein JWO84_717 [Parcubacteria group bacterium]|nr:hypothetical protein [Parcubacteria group bacterium]
MDDPKYIPNAYVYSTEGIRWEQDDVDLLDSCLDHLSRSDESTYTGYLSRPLGRLVRGLYIDGQLVVAWNPKPVWHIDYATRPLTGPACEEYTFEFDRVFFDTHYEELVEKLSWRHEQRGVQEEEALSKAREFFIRLKEKF